MVFAREGRLDGRSDAGIVAQCRQLFVGNQLGLHDDIRPPVQRLDFVGDSYDRALGEGYETRRRHTYRTSRGRSPLRGPPQRTGTEVEHAIVCAQIAVANVERLVIDEQTEQLAVGDVDERLGRL